MKIKITLDEQGYIDNWCEIGELENAIEIDLAATSYEHFIANSNAYKVVKGKAKFDNEKYNCIIGYENKVSRIEYLKQQLNDTDYKIIKHVEGQLDEQEYLEVKNQRQLWRDEINILEEEIQV